MVLSARRFLAVQRSFLAGVLIAFAAALLLGSCAQSRSVSGLPEAIKSDYTIGVYDPDKVFNASNQIAIEQVYLDWSRTEQMSIIEDADTYGSARERWLLITLEPWEREGASTVDLLTDIAAGRYDDLIDQNCEQIARVSTGTFIRWGHEMDVPSGRYPWAVEDPVQFVLAYRHFFERCNEKLSDKADIFFVWSPVIETNHAIRYYPGDAYVDLVGFPVFDCISCAPQHRAKTRSFRAIFERKLSVVEFTTKPIMVVEMGVEGDAKFQRKWLRDACSDASSYEALKHMNYFNALDHPNVWGKGTQPDWSLIDGPDVFCPD